MWINFKINDQRNHNLDLFKAKKPQKHFKCKRGKEGHQSWLTKSTFSMYFFSALAWFKQSLILLHSQREALKWQITVHNLKLFAASVSWVWSFNGPRRENLLYKRHLSRHTEDIWDNLEHVDQVDFLCFWKLPPTSHRWILWYPVWLSVFPPFLPLVHAWRSLVILRAATTCSRSVKESSP